MNLRGMLFVLTLLTVALSLAVAQEPSTLFQQGIEAYREGKWEQAAAAWEKLEQTGAASGALYYNLGNAHHRMGQIGQSVLYYERALKLRPRDRDVKANLDLARMGTVDRMEVPIRLIVWDWVDSVRDFFSLRELFRLFVAIGLLLVPAFVLWRFGPIRVRVASRSILTILLVCYGLLLGWYVWRSELDARPFAVVLETKVDVHSAPDESATQVFTLHEGAKLLAVENLTGWTLVRLSDGRQGWLPTDTIEKI